MGTKAIEKVLLLARRDRLPSPMQICDAERELEAIRKAAKDYVECLSGTSANSHQRPETRERQVRPLLESIAKEGT